MGENVFTHESGIHVSGLLRDPANYQHIDPRELGRDHRLVLGKHSGSAAVRWAYGRLGIRLDEEGARAVLPLLREHAARTKRPPEQADLLRFLDAARGAGTPEDVGDGVPGDPHGKRPGMRCASPSAHPHAVCPHE